MTSSSFVEWMRGTAWTALVILLIVLICVLGGCATTPEPRACVAPAGSALISLDDVEKINAEYARVRRELSACRQGHSS